MRCSELGGQCFVGLAKHLTSCGDAGKADVAGALINAEVGWHRALDEGEVDGGKPVCGEVVPAGAMDAPARRGDGASGLQFGD